MPAAKPETIPAAMIVATDVSELAHVPPPVGSVKEIVLPEHTVLGPVMVAGEALIVTTVVV